MGKTGLAAQSSENQEAIMETVMCVWRGATSLTKPIKEKANMQTEEETKGPAAKDKQSSYSCPLV
jgi:hypothetical protein